MPEAVSSSAAPVITAETPPLGVDEHGVIRVAGTRLALDTVIGAFLDGESPEAIADQYPSLSLSDVYATVTYYLAHRGDVDAYLCRRTAIVAQTQRELEQCWPPHGLRARLLARRDARKSEAKA